MRTILSICVGVMLLAPPARADDHTKDTLDTVKKNLKDKKAILVDVREKREWDEGHVKDAKLLPLSELAKGADAKKLAQTLPKDTIIYCHCGAGRRALKAGEILKKAGYDVRPLKPGFSDLVKAGFASVTPAKPKDDK